MQLEWHEYFMGSLKAPMGDGKHYLINMTASGGGLQARFSDGVDWVWSGIFDESDAAKNACQAHFDLAPTP